MDVISRKMDKISEEMRGTSQRLASLEYDAQQPRLALEANGQADTETRGRTEGAATAVQAMHGDRCSANRVDPSPKTTSTSLGVKVDPSALPCRDDVLVDNGAAAPKSCLQLLETRSPTAAGGFLPTGEASIATRSTYNQPPLRLHSAKETNSKTTDLRTPILSVSYDRSFFWKNNLPAAPPAGGSSRQNRGKVGCLIQAVSRLSPRLPVFGNVARVALW